MTQEPLELIAFRVDHERVVAVLSVFDDISTRRVEPISPRPTARFGFPFFEPWPELRARVPEAARDVVDWTLHLAPGRTARATRDRIVGGNAHCLDALGVLLTIRPEDRSTFERTREHYFIAVPDAGSRTMAPGPRLGPLNVQLSTRDREGVEKALSNRLLVELPRTIAKSAADKVPGSAGRERIDQALRDGRGRLVYDTQAYRLEANTPPVLFVRARWFVDRSLGFAGAFWLKSESGSDEPRVIDADLWSAWWLRTRLSRGQVHDQNLGLVLNVFDRDGDGRAEVLIARGFYEGLSLQLLEYGPSGLEPTGIRVDQGC